VRAVTVSGVTGGEAEKNANGEFEEAVGLYGGRRHWQKRGDADVWLLHIKGRWWVTDTADKDAEASSGWVCSEPTEAQDPLGVTAWEAYVNDAWVVQGSIAVSEPGGEPGAAPATAAAPAEGGSVLTTLPDGTVRFTAGAEAGATAEGGSVTASLPERRAESVVTTLPDGTVRFTAGAKAGTAKGKPQEKKGIFRRVWDKLRGKK